MLRTALLLLALCAAAVPVAAQSAESHAAAGDSASAQPEAGPAEPSAVDHGAAAEHAEGAPHAETIWGPVSRAFNSAILFGVLYYFLRKPVASYLSSRDSEIRNDLVTAGEMRKTAAAQLAALEQKMAALPGELESLKTRGQQEIAAEEARIEQAAAAERERLLDQTRREIDLQLRLAKRELLEHAANLSVGLATEQVRRDITPTDQERLVDRYVRQVNR